MTTSVRFPRLEAMELDLAAASSLGRAARDYIADAITVGGDSSCYDFMAQRAYQYAKRAGAAARRAIPELRA